MNVILVGAGGIPAAFTVIALCDQSSSLGVDEVVLFDIDTERLKLTQAVLEAYLPTLKHHPKIITINDMSQYSGKPDVAILSIRPGQESARANDERLCRELGLLASETVGAAGHAFALRAVPPILKYAEWLTSLNPDILLINFTNPAGIVTQALLGNGYKRSIGVCSSADRIRQHVSEYYETSQQDIKTHVFGLNHLSWTENVWVSGQDVTTKLLHDDRFLDIAQPLFPKNLMQDKGMLFNDYLYLYYCNKEVMARQTSRPTTRGEDVEKMSAEYRQTMHRLIENRSPAGDIRQAYLNYIRNRKGTSHPGFIVDSKTLAADLNDTYSGMALEAIKGLVLKQSIDMPILTTLDINYSGFSADEVVEISVQIRQGAIHPAQPMELDAGDQVLVHKVKEFEKRTLIAVTTGNIEDSIAALDTHPLLQNHQKNVKFAQMIRKN